MASSTPDHCRHCGGAAAPVDPPTVFRCVACERYLFHNPDPNARVIVVDDSLRSASRSQQKRRRETASRGP